MTSSSLRLFDCTCLVLCTLEQEPTPEPAPKPPPRNQHQTSKTTCQLSVTFRTTSNHPATCTGSDMRTSCPEPVRSHTGSVWKPQNVHNHMIHMQLVTTSGARTETSRTNHPGTPHQKPNKTANAVGQEKSSKKMQHMVIVLLPNFKAV